MNVIFTKAELFAIKYGISQAIQSPNVEQIVIIMDVIPTARYIFDLLLIFSNCILL